MVEMCLIPAQMLISLLLPRLPKQTPLFTHSLSTHLALSIRSLSTRSLITAIEGEDRTWLIDIYPPRTRTRTRTRSLQMISLSPTIHSPNPNQTAEDDDQPISQRIQRLSLHLNPPPIHPDRQVTDALELQSCAKRTKLSVSTQQLSDYMRGKHMDIQERVFEYFNSRPDLQTPVEISKNDHRELCMRQLLGLVREAGIRPFRYVADDPSKYFAIAEAVGSVDMSLGIKMGVQYSIKQLWCCYCWENCKTHAVVGKIVVLLLLGKNRIV